MLINTFLVIIFFINLVFLFIFHPLAIIFVLIIQTILISTLIYSIVQFPWFSYTLILVFLGGILILFTYISNIASNEIFKPNLKVILPLILAPFVTILITNSKQNISIERKIINSIQYTNLTIFKPFSETIIPLTLLIALYIILTLLTVVKIRKISQGPLRII